MCGAPAWALRDRHDVVVVTQEREECAKPAVIIVVISLLARDDHSLDFFGVFPYSLFLCVSMACRVLFMGDLEVQRVC